MPDVESEEIPGARRPKMAGLLRKAAALLVLLILSGCEVAGVLIDAADLGFCSGCDWIIQEWDSVGWNTHNSKPYDTEEICEQELAKQSKENSDHGYRCINEEDLIHKKTETMESEHCWGCDWVIEEWRHSAWERRDARTYHTEGVCQQALWHRSKDNPYTDYRCLNLDL